MSYQHLTQSERTAIFYLKQYGLSFREIGRRLNRHHSSISREYKRNTTLGGHYLNDVAHEYAQKRRQKPRHFRRRITLDLVDFVEHCLRLDWSPQIIVHRLRRRFPRSHLMRLSAETIYQWVYRDAQAGGSLYCHLLRRHKRRRKQKRYGALRGVIPNRIGIERRPAGATNRTRYGHWEGDTVEGKKGSGGVATHVERKSRLLIAAKLNNGTAQEMTAQSGILFQRIPEAWRRTLTVDNGKEFARFKALEQATGMFVYFSNPYSPWERGTNEQTNGLLRFYFPKGIDWRTVSDQELAWAVNRINNRPRKCLNYRTPLELSRQILGGALRI